MNLAFAMLYLFNLFLEIAEPYNGINHIIAMTFWFLGFVLLLGMVVNERFE